MEHALSTHTHALEIALERLASAAGVREVAEAIGDWRDLGLADAVILWVHDPHHDRLQLTGARGVAPSIRHWRPGPRASRGVLWRALGELHAIPLDLAAVPLGLAAPLKIAVAEHWEAVPLRALDGSAVGVVVVGGSSERHDRLPWSAAGAALARAILHDDAVWRSAWLDTALPLLHDGVIIATTDGDLLLYGDGLERVTGWTAEDIRARGWTNLVYPDPETRAELQGAIAALVLGRPSEGVVRSLRCKDGRTIQAKVWSRLVPHPSDGAPAMIGVLQDVTEERTAARRQARDASLATLGRLAGGVAHEFNNLLGAIMGHAELIELDEHATETLRRRAATIVGATQRGAYLSRQLLAFSGAQVSQSTPVRIGPLVEEIVELFRPALDPGTHIELTVSAGLAAVEVDEAQLQQALTNLLANARDATPPQGRIHVRVDAAPLPENPRYRSPSAPPEGHAMCRVRVRDDGEGFSTDALANLFEPFFSRKARGHGLGLPAVRGIVGTLEGAVDIHNDGGAVVDLYLPFSDRPELDLPRLIAQQGAASGVVWVIDDEPALLEFSRIALQIHGFDPVAFPDGASVLAHAQLGSPRPDALVVDVVMPGLTGPQTVEALRALGIDAPLVWTSGYTPDSANVPPHAGVFLQKPFTGRELADVVRRVKGPAG